MHFERREDQEESKEHPDGRLYVPRDDEAAANNADDERERLIQTD